MALSGRINGTCTGPSIDKYDLWVDWTVNSQNIINNTSNVTVIMRLQRNDGYANSAYNLTGSNPVYLDVQYSQRVGQQINIDTRNSAIVELASWTGNISHDSSGQLNLNISGVFTLNGVSSLTGGSVEGTVSVNSIDRTEPVVSLSVSEITTSTVKLSASSNVQCNLWEYSKDGGNTWYTYNTSSVSAAFVTLTGLAPNTQYQFKVRARKVTNYVYGSSSTVTATTLGTTTINSVSNIFADAETVDIVMNLTAANASFLHTLEILSGSTVVLTITGITALSGTNYKTVTLTTEQRTSLLSFMYSTKSFTATLRLTTLDGSTTVGISQKSVLISTSENLSAPLFTGFTFSDYLSTTANITGNNQVLIQGFSKLRVICSAATPRNSASIVSYSAVCGNKSKSGSSTTINLDEISTAGELMLSVTVTDSRGYSVTINQTVIVTPYTKPIIQSTDIRRQNGVDNTIQLGLTGEISNILVSSVNQNSVTVIQYRYKKTSETSYGPWVSLLSASIISGNEFSYESLEAFSLDAAFSWNVQLQVQDNLGSLSPYTLDLLVPQGTPLISLRPKKVGINNPDPQSVLDVIGDIRMNNAGILGRKTQTAIDFNLLTEQGVYYFDRAASGSVYPSGINAPGEPMNANVIVLNPSGIFVTQLYFSEGGDFYTRKGSYSGSSWTWASWALK